ncbi:MAG: dipeptidase PepE, partial [Rikenellaceae bacterium]
DGHAGETREQRIEEYIAANRSMTVVGLREACMFHIDGNSIKLIGKRDLRIFKFGQPAYELNNSSDLSFLMK